MADVQLIIGGIKYSLACGDGQEERLRTLAAQLDEKVSAIKQRRLMPEGLALVMGSLVLASELTEKYESVLIDQRENMITPEVLAQTVQLVEKVSERISGVAESIENA